MTRSLLEAPAERPASARPGFPPETSHSAAGERSAQATASPPLQRRLLANRENARKSTGPKTSLGKAASRSNALRHGLTANAALPPEIMGEIATQFWQNFDAFRPADAVAVNAVLELSICSWKFRRLFEQYVGHSAVSRLTVNGNRIARDKRQAQKWFRSLHQDARKALAHLESSFAGLTLILESLDNLLAEIAEPEGSWTSAQFLLAVNLAGYDEIEIWDHVQLRSLWSAWFACRPGRKAALMESPSCLPQYPEYRNRARQAMEAAPLPADGRRKLLEWTQQLREAFANRIEGLERVEDERSMLDPMAAGWPAPEETSQHLLYLRYSNQVDRKTRELHAIIAARPAQPADSPWTFDETMLPLDWRAILIDHRARPGSVMTDETAETEAAGAAPADIDVNDLSEEAREARMEAITERMIEWLVRTNSPPEVLSENPAAEPGMAEPVAIEAAAAESEAVAGIPASGSMSVAADSTARTAGESAISRATKEMAIESSTAAQPPDPAETATPQAIEAERPATGSASAAAPPAIALNRKSRRKLRQDQAADVRKGRHPHAVPRRGQPVDPKRP